MAIAGKVAITLSTENGGAWSADVTYDRLVAVKHNNNLYISRKTVANVEPPNDEFWFLALEGFGGDDVQALIDRMNELSDLIQAIINGTTQVGNAKTLDGHEVEYFAKAAELFNYLSKSGGDINGLTYFNVPSDVPVFFNNTVGANGVIPRYSDTSGILGFLGFVGANRLVFKDNTLTNTYDLLHTGNKPTGTYTGNGDATERIIEVGGLAKGVIITSSDYGGMALVTAHGAICKTSDGTTVSGVPWGEVGFNGKIILKTTNPLLNASGVLYNYISF